MEKTEGVKRYLDGLKEMLAVRAKNEGVESPEEDAICDSLDDLWYALTEEEMEYVNTVGLGD